VAAATDKERRGFDHAQSDLVSHRDDQPVVPGVGVWQLIHADA
jgi:hypothetical protein